VTTGVVGTNGFVASTGSAVRADIDLSQNNATQRADQLTVRSGTASGNTTIAFNVLNKTPGFFANPIPVLVTPTTGSAITATAINLPANAGPVTFSLVKDAPGAPPGFSVVSTFNTAAVTSTITGILASVSSIDASFHQPASALVASAAGTDPNKWSGGPWVRVSGGRNTIDSTGASVGLAGAGGLTAGATSRVETAFQGIQGGFDSGVLNVGSTMWNVHLGVTGGEIRADSRETLGNSAADRSLINFRVPFIGLYLVATRGNFYADVTVRRDFLGMDITNQSVGLSGTEFRGNATNVNASTGYHQELGNGLFFEPSAAISWTRSNFSSIAIPAGGSIDFDTVQSLLGRVGFRVGRSFSVGDIVNLTPFASFSAWREFENNATATTTLSTATFGLTTTRVGTFYQGSAGISFQVPNTGFLGFVRGDMRFGQNIEGWTALGGLRYTFGPY
jgi:outer membrane autotransporter protein